MLIIPPPKYLPRRGHANGKTAPAPPGPVALVLVSASYDSARATITLGFDRAVDVSGLDGSVIIVNDPVTNMISFTATSTVTIIDPQTVQISMYYLGDATGSDVTLNAAAGNGIVAVDDGATWAGVSGAVLPYSG